MVLFHPTIGFLSYFKHFKKLLNYFVPDSGIMKVKQSLFDVTINILYKVKSILEELRADVVLDFWKKIL